LVATLLARAFFSRRTYSVAVIVVAICVLSTASTVIRRFALAGMVWLLVFVAYSWFNFTSWFPAISLEGMLQIGEDLRRLAVTRE
jgi:hypothetical protein